MGPSTNVDGELDRGVLADLDSLGFNGAVDERRRRGKPVGSSLKPHGRFNGAVDERRRRGCAGGEVRLGRLDASMGPSTNVDGERRANRRDDAGPISASMGPSTNVDGE